jgi:hypothetical protein
MGCVTVSRAHAQSLTVADPRPVAAALERIEAIYGTPVTYEDTLYDYDTQVMDVTSSVRRDHASADNANRVLVPMSRRLTFTYTPPRTTVKEAPPSRLSPDLVAAIKNALDSYAASRGVPMFALVEDNSLLHVVAMRFVNASGYFQSFTPLLDMRISLEARQRSALELIAAICEKVSLVYRRTVVVGTAPINLLMAHNTQVGVANQKARVVLDKLFQEIGEPLSYQLFCDARLRECALNTHLVKRQVASPQ